MRGCWRLVPGVVRIIEIKKGEMGWKGPRTIRPFPSKVCRMKGTAPGVVGPELCWVQMWSLVGVMFACNAALSSSSVLSAWA